jgi:hypothetical protein
MGGVLSALDLQKGSKLDRVYLMVIMIFGKLTDRIDVTPKCYKPGWERTIWFWKQK